MSLSGMCEVSSAFVSNYFIRKQMEKFSHLLSFEFLSKSITLCLETNARPHDKI